MYRQVLWLETRAPAAGVGMTGLVAILVSCPLSRPTGPWPYRHVIVLHRGARKESLLVQTAGLSPLERWGVEACM